jgi:1-acyl-sn-glycerol-3-phosphate acyltransferase
MHGRIHVVLKESLKKLPFLGWGMALSKFIFLKRNWEEDKAGLANHLQSLNNVEDPMWLMFFPEGTNLAPSTRQKSKKWAEENGLKDFQHVLLPRSTGLHFVLLKLRETVDYVYDCTVGYEGVKRGEYAQDIYTIEASLLNGHPPKSVNMYWRRFKISTIPLDDINRFGIWLRARWAEKDALMEQYMRTGRFPADEGVSQTPEGDTRRGAGYIETQVKPYKWYEILQVFAPIATFVMVLFYFYDITLPTTFTSTIQDWAGYSEDEIKKKLRIGPAPKLGKPKAITSSTVAKTLKPPSICSDQASTISIISRAKPVPKAPAAKLNPQAKLTSAPKAIVTEAQPTANGLVLRNPPSQAAAPKGPTLKPTPTSKAPINTAPAQKLLPNGKTLQANASKAPPKAPPTLPKKPLRKTVYPPTPPTSPPKKPLPKTLYPTVYPSTTNPPPKKPSAQKPAPAPTPRKPTPKAEGPQKPSLLPNTEPPRASTQATTEGWSDTTAVDTTPWADRPSGKRAVKAQETRKERTKMEKREQRLHLEKTAG